jgi:hypothetical protein
MPPGLTDATANAASASASARDEPDQQWFTLGVLGPSTSDATGVRLQVDLWGTRAWSIGIGGSLVQRGDQVMGVSVPLASGVVYLAHTNALVGPFHLRLQAGFGSEVSASATESSVVANESLAGVMSTSPIVEGAIFVDADLGDHWGLAAGPIAQYASAPATGYDASTYVLFAGIQHR